jgi:hypothetical protein
VSTHEKVADLLREAEGRVLAGRLAQMVMVLIADEMEPIMGTHTSAVFWEDAVEWIRSQAELW